MKCFHCRSEIDICPYCGKNLERKQAASTYPPILMAELVMRNIETGEVINFTLWKDNSIIGRADEETTDEDRPDLDLSSLDPEGYISHHQARIFKQGDQFFIEDLDSVNGSYLANKKRSFKLRPHEPEIIDDGSTVRFAHLMGRFSCQHI